MLIGYAAVDEYTQQFVNRSADILDWCADSAAVLIVLSLLELLRRRRNKSINAEGR